MKCSRCQRTNASYEDLRAAKQFGFMVGGVGTLLDPPSNRKVNGYDSRLCYVEVVGQYTASWDEERKRSLSDCQKGFKMIHWLYPSSHVGCRIDVEFLSNDKMTCDRKEVTCPACLVNS